MSSQYSILHPMMKDKIRKDSNSSARVNFAANPTIVINGPGPPGESEIALNNLETSQASQPETPAAGTPVSRSPSVPRSCTDCTAACKPTAKHGRVVLGLTLMVAGAIAWAGTTVCAKRIYQWPHFYAPYFVIYFSTSWMLLFYPVYISGQLLRAKGKLALKETFRESVRVFGDEGLGPSPYKSFAKVLAFCVLWDFAAYVYLRAISFKSALDAVALFATNSNFVYLMSWIVLQKKFIAARIVAFIVSMTGIIMLTYMDSGFASEGMWGSVLAMIATASAAAYKVLFRRVLGDVTYDQMACFLTALGLCNVITMWPLFLVFYFTKAEPLEWDKVPWAFVTGAAGFGLVLNLILQFGAVVAYHLLVQACFIIAIPVCVVAEIVIDGVDSLQIEGLQIGAYVLVSVGFFLNILPENWHNSLLKLIRWKRQDNRSHNDRATTPRQRIRSQADISSMSNSHC